MTFGGEPLLYADTVCKIHETAYANKVNQRDIITNGFFSKNTKVIEETVDKICKSHINNVLLSVDAFHQEKIPIEPVIHFAKTLKSKGSSRIRVHPAWLNNKDDDNLYNNRTKSLLKIFTDMGIELSDGNIIFPAGNAIKYLKEYFPYSDNIDLATPCGTLPYTGQLDKIECIGINPNGDVLTCSFPIGNVYKNNILDIIDKYDPFENIYTKLLIEGGVKKLLDYVEDMGVKVDTKNCYSSCMVCNSIVESLKIKAFI
jgi:sulfatase maturation enzyme AslB (radical SAM superfamily)